MTERDYLAAEHALGLLEGEALIEARSLMASDPAFAAEVAQWAERFAPMFEEIAEAAPPTATWGKILSGISDGGGDVVVLRQRVRRWQWATAAASIAAAAALVVAIPALQPTASVAPTVVRTHAPLMVASLMGEDKQMMLSATWDADSASLMVAPGRMANEPGKSHELWIIPADGKPRSLGMVEAGAPKRMAVPARMMDQFGADAMLALSVEPAGGSPGPGPSGPVVASGALATV